MPYKSEFTIDIPRTDLLTYFFPPDKEDDGDQPIWISAADPSIFLDRKHAVQWIRRMAVGLRKLQFKTGDVVLMISPNHVFVPVAYIGSIAYGAVFSGLTPLASVNGNHRTKTYDIC
jgi:acyl-coenzyme A synthetase/AMP-(fatty) acid ligase